jgi:hypothetical protein
MVADAINELEPEQDADDQGKHYLTALRTRNDSNRALLNTLSEIYTEEEEEEE